MTEQAPLFLPQTREIATKDVVARLEKDQIKASLVGPTITGVDDSNREQFLYELCWAVCLGELAPARFPTGIAAAGFPRVPASEKGKDGAQKDGAKGSGAMEIDGDGNGAAKSATEFSAEEVPHLLCDMLWTVWSTLEAELDASGFKVSGDAAPRPEEVPEPHRSRRARLVDVVKVLQRDGWLTRAILMETMDATLMYEAGVVPQDPERWKQTEIRYHTRTVYLQPKYNLFREEPEGFAKLAVLLGGFSNAGRVTRDNVPDVAAEIQGIVGHFGVDPNRALDVVLTAFEAQPDNAAMVDLLKEQRFKTDAVVQLVGFRLTQCDKEGNTPPAVVRVAAQLLHGGAFTLEELYPHLSPTDDALADACTKARSALDNAVADLGTIKGSDALFAAERALAVSPQDLAVDDVRAKHDAALPSACPKVALCSAVLNTSGWAAAAPLLRRLRALGVEPLDFTPVAAAACRAVERDLLDPLHSALHPARNLRARPIVDAHADRAKWGAYADAARALGAGAVPPEALAAVRALGHHAHLSTSLLIKTCRVVRHHLLLACQPALRACVFPASSHPDEALTAALRQQSAMEDVLVESVLPGLILCPVNAGLAAEVWEVLRLLPYTTRFRLYSELKGASQGNALLAAARQKADRSVKRVTKRLVAVGRGKGGARSADAAELEQADRRARAIARVMYAHPWVGMQAVLTQVGDFPELVDTLVDGAKFFTPLAVDACVFLALEKFAVPAEKLSLESERHKPSYYALARLMGALCKRGGGSVVVPVPEVKAVLQFVANSLKQNRWDDVLLLNRLASEMTGVSEEVAVGEKVTQALGGGPALLHAAAAGPDEPAVPPRKAATALRAQQVLLRAITSADRPEEALAWPLLALLCQLRDVVFGDDDADGLRPVKARSFALDRARGDLAQLATVLDAGLDAAEYASLLPSPSRMVLHHGIDVDLTYLLHRPALARKMVLLSEEGEMEVEGGRDAAAAEQWAAALEDAKAIMSPATLAAMTPELYLTFWVLDIRDIWCPAGAYDEQLRLLEERIKQRERAIIQLRKQARTAQVAEDLEKAQADRSAARHAIETLQAERAECEKRVADRRAALRAARTRWIPAKTDQHQSTILIKALLQSCIVPRAMGSPEGAAFCARFIELLHESEAPLFSTWSFLNQALRTVPVMVYCCTEHEANNVGLFLEGVLGLIRRWAADKDTYEREASSKIGMATQFTADQVETSARASHVDFLRLQNRWEKDMTRIWSDGLKSSEATMVRNTLGVLHRISRSFPLKASTAQELYWRARDLKKAMEEAGRKDIAMRADMYGIQLFKLFKGEIVELRPEEAAALRREKERREREKREEEARRERERKEREAEKGKEKEKQVEKAREKEKAKEKDKEGEKGREKEKERIKERLKEREAPKDKDRESERTKDKRDDSKQRVAEVVAPRAGPDRTEARARGPERERSGGRAEEVRRDARVRERDSESNAATPTAAERRPRGRGAREWDRGKVLAEDAAVPVRREREADDGRRGGGRGPEQARRGAEADAGERPRIPITAAREAALSSVRGGRREGEDGDAGGVSAREGGSERVAGSKRAREEGSPPAESERRSGKSRKRGRGDEGVRVVPVEAGEGGVDEGEPRGEKHRRGEERRERKREKRAREEAAQREEKEDKERPSKRKSRKKH
ncbi:unnamed protein product [Pedinophyceae sp. YPF-701]|nr:unnamed protein product [Pedinophyceae sp. YPF-701]